MDNKVLFNIHINMFVGGGMLYKWEYVCLYKISILLLATINLHIFSLFTQVFCFISQFWLVLKCSISRSINYRNKFQWIVLITSRSNVWSRLYIRKRELPLACGWSIPVFKEIKILKAMFSKSHILEDKSNNSFLILKFKYKVQIWERRDSNSYEQVDQISN